MTVRKAIVLAAGHGTRLRPFTCATPKPLMPVWGEPMLARIFRMLRSWGVTDFAVNAHCLHEQVRAWCDDYRRECRRAGERIKVRVSYESEILGTGGVFNPLREWIGDEPFYLVNGDIIAEGLENASPFPNCDELMANKNLIATALVTESGPRTIEVEPQTGFVTNWRSEDAGYEGTFTYCGIAIIKPSLLKFVKADGFSSVIAAYEKAMTKGKFVRAVKPENLLWTDAGTIKSYIALNQTDDDNAFSDFPQVKAALKASGIPDTPVEFLSARGSDRVFFRCEKGILIVYDDGNRDENGLYAGHARYLKSRGIPVPEVVADLPAIKTMVLSDSGVERKMTLEEYVKVVETLVKFNALGEEFTAENPSKDLPSLLPEFDDETWEWERNLFCKHCLGSRFGRKMTKAVQRELENVAALLEREPKALVHRDFQSTNVLWKGKKLSFIDFQGMRLGPAVYDLASLVYDPYVTLTKGERRALIALYAKKCGRPECAKMLPYAAVQRLLQCLGAYGRLASVGQPQFSKWVLPALANLLEAATSAGLTEVCAMVRELIAEERHNLKHAEAAEHTCTCGHDHGHACTCGHDHHPSNGAHA